MELTENEKKLIEAIREMNEVPSNVLLWYAAGLEEASKHSHELRQKTDRQKIEIADAWMRSM